MDIFKLSALAVTAALCALFLREKVPALAAALALGAGALLLGQAVEPLARVRQLSDAMARETGLSARVWAPVWKTVGIALVTRVSAALCRDAGQGGVAAFLETAGAALALVAVLPLMQSVFDVLGALF